MNYQFSFLCKNNEQFSFHRSKWIEFLRDFSESQREIFADMLQCYLSHSDASQCIEDRLTALAWLNIVQDIGLDCLRYEKFDVMCNGVGLDILMCDPNSSSDSEGSDD